MDVIPIPAFNCFIAIAFSRQIKWGAASKFDGSLVTNELAVSGQPNYLVCHWEAFFLKKSNINKNKTSPFHYFLNDSVAPGYQRTLGPAASVLVAILQGNKNLFQNIWVRLDHKQRGCDATGHWKSLCLLPQHWVLGAEKGTGAAGRALGYWDLEVP